MIKVIQIRRLTKHFEDITAVAEVDIDIFEKECFGLLGPNGAGKTTLVKMLTAVMPPTSGQIWIDGRDLKKYARQVKSQFGVVPQAENLDPELSVFRNLTIFARYFDISQQEAERRAHEVLAFFKLEAKTHSEIKKLSGGMKRRLLIARGMINKPRILVLDEPTVGLDPQAKYLVWQKLKELKSQGVTQLISTQNMDEATVLCDRVAIMHQGKTLAIDSPRALIKEHVGGKMVEIAPGSDNRELIISELERLNLNFETSESGIYLYQCKAEKIAANLKALGWNTWVRLATLEDVFFRLTGRAMLE
jgi:lipooligosaccharide transport system ATP-binding protein